SRRLRSEWWSPERLRRWRLPGAVILLPVGVRHRRRRPDQEIAHTPMGANPQLPGRSPEHAPSYRRATFSPASPAPTRASSPAKPHSLRRKTTADFASWLGILLRRVSRPQLALQPRLGDSQVAANFSYRHVEHFRGILSRHSSKETHLDKTAF